MVGPFSIGLKGDCVMVDEEESKPLRQRENPQLGVLPHDTFSHWALSTRLMQRECLLRLAPPPLSCTRSFNDIYEVSLCCSG